MKNSIKESLRLLPYRTDWITPPLTNTENTEEDLVEAGLGHPYSEVSMGKCTGKEDKVGGVSL